MTTSLYFTPDDRDDQGFVRVEVLPPDVPAPAPDAPPVPAIEREAQQDTVPRTPRRKEPEGGAERPPLKERQTAAILVGLALIAIAAMVLMSRYAPAAPMRGTVTQPTAAAIAPVPTLVWAPTATPRLLVVYWAPGGEKAPPLAVSAVRTPSGRFGQDWLQETLPGGGRVWLNMDEQQLDRTDIFLALPDLAPRPTPELRPAPLAVPASSGAQESAATATPAREAATAVPTFDSLAYQRQLDATATAIYATAAALGAPGGVVPFTPTDVPNKDTP